jgi:hypothetical protein
MEGKRCGSRIYKKGEELLKEDEYRIQNLISWILIFLLTINHPAYEKKEEEPDSALQRSRIKRGKETLSKYVYVRMKPHIKAALSAGDGTIRAPHWRRGHVRRLADGRVVPVQACLVNWEGDPEDPAAPAKKIYVV